MTFVLPLDSPGIGADTPTLHPDDLGALRGDGVFETVHVRSNEPFLLPEHVARMGRSAARLEFELPGADRLEDLGRRACREAFASGALEPGTEAALRLIATRGREGGGPATVYATVREIPEEMRLPRRDGLRLTARSIGYAAAERDRSPWLLGGAKSLSYATAMAVQRHARAAGYDDALWVSADGWALEGPTSTLVWQQGDALFTIPSEGTGILPGTTAAKLFELAPQAGLRPQRRMARVGELEGAAGVWMASSVRGLAPVRELDLSLTPGDPRPEPLRFPVSPANAQLQKLMGFDVPA